MKRGFPSSVIANCFLKPSRTKAHSAGRCEGCSQALRPAWEPGPVETAGTSSREEKQPCCLQAAATAMVTPAWQRQGRSRPQRIDFLLSAHKQVFVIFVRCAAFGCPVRVLSTDVSHWKQPSSSSTCAPQNPQARELVENQRWSREEPWEQLQHQEMHPTA